MKIIIESSAYLVMMALICLLSIDFISMNQHISSTSEVEQYIRDYIEIYGEHQEGNHLDAAVVARAQQVAEDHHMEFSYEYETKTKNYAYYQIHIRYTLQSMVFRIAKTHTYDGLVRVELVRL